MAHRTDAKTTATDPEDHHVARATPTQEAALTSPQPASRRRRLRWALGLIVGLLAVGIGVGVFAIGEFGTSSENEAADNLLVTAQGSLIQEDGGQPELCTVTTASLPPRCGGGISVEGVNMAELPYAETQATVSWASVRVTGRWNGTTLTATEVVESWAPRVGSASPDRSPACEPPTGGWEDSRIELEIEPIGPEGNAYRVATTELDAYIDEHRDVFGGTWLNPPHTVQSVLFTEDVATHEAAIRDFYEGQLCVAEAEYSMAELEAMERQMDADDVELRSEGAYVTSSYIDIPANRIELRTVVADDTAVAVMEDRYGDAVHIEGWFEIVE